MTNEELAELERLLVKATPGEWSCLNKVGVVFGPDCQVAHCGDFGDKELVPFNADRWQSDAALIVALRNAAPSLIATAREAEALRARLHKLYTIILENSPDTTIADNGMTVWDGLHNEARAALKENPNEG